MYVTNLRLFEKRSLSSGLPERYSFSQLYNELAGDDTISKAVRSTLTLIISRICANELYFKESLENIIVLASCLDEPTRLARETGDQDAISKISSWVSKMILPDGSTIPQDDIPSGMFPVTHY